MDTKAYRSAARELLHRAVDRPDIYLSTVRCMLSRTKAKVTHLALLKHLRRCRLGFERIRSTLSGFSTALLWDGTSGNEHLHKAGDSFQQWRVAVLPRTSDSPCALLVRELLLETNFKMDTEVVTVSLAARGMVQQTVSGRLLALVGCRNEPVQRTCMQGHSTPRFNTADVGTKFHTQRRLDEWACS